MHDKFKTDFSPSSGYPYASTDIQILDENDKELSFEECGEICVKGPQVMTGYWELEEESKQAFTKDSFFRTGDMGYIGNDGELYIVDRKKDMINVSGFNVFAQEVENVANSHPDIIESGVISIPNEKTGEAVMLFIVSDNKDLTQENISSFCKEHLTNYKIPKKVQFVDEIPKSPVGKLLRRELKKLL
jgi:long-chain acyl-CoA synthetase